VLSNLNQSHGHFVEVVSIVRFEMILDTTSNTSVRFTSTKSQNTIEWSSVVQVPQQDPMRRTVARKAKLLFTWWVMLLTPRMTTRTKRPCQWTMHHICFQTSDGAGTTCCHKGWNNIHSSMRSEGGSRSCLASRWKPRHAFTAVARG